MTPPVRGRMPRKTKNSRIQKHEIVLDIANVDNMVAILRHAYESAESFVKNFDQNIGSPDFAMYNCMNELMKMIEGVQEQSEEIKIFYKMDGDLRCAHFEDFVNLEESIAGFGTTKEDAKKQLFKCYYFFLMNIK